MTETLRRHRGAAMIALLALAAALALWADINAGYRSISLDELGQIARGAAPASLTYTLVELRLPRVLTALLVGAGLSLAGCLLQGVSRNDMADPGVLGINAGAAFALALCLALLPGMSFAGVVACSFAGAALALAVVFGAVSFRRRNMDPVLLVLAGCAVGLFLTALAQGVAIFFNIGYALTFWTAGGVAGTRRVQHSTMAK